MRVFRQFGLLLQKNLILAKRSKVWTFFEVALPVLFVLPVFIYLARMEQKFSPETGASYYDLHGSSMDEKFSVTCSETGNETFYVSYSANEYDGIALEIMENIAKSYQSIKSVHGSHLEREPRKFSSMDEMVSAMKTQNESCGPEVFVVGILFEKLDITNGKLRYTVAYPLAKGSSSYSLNSDFYERYSSRWSPSRPSESIKMLPSLQKAVDSLFIKRFAQLNATEAPQKIAVFPKPKFNQTGFSGYCHLLYFLCTLLPILHTARTIAQEKATVRDFLRVMGLDSFMFYYSHIVYAWLKCCLILIVCSIPLIIAIEQLSAVFMIISMVLYSLAAVTFAALISAIFTSPNTVLQAGIFCWLVLSSIPIILQTDISKIGLNLILNLNLNGALASIFGLISMHVDRNYKLTLGTMFDEGSLRYTCGFALIMIIIDIIWMTVALFLIDYLKGHFNVSIWDFLRRNNRNGKVTVQEIRGGHEFDEDSNSIADLEIKDLVKVWETTGERAVDGISLKAFRGQTTVLLGHNGAGKSTTFSALCGLTQATSGEIKIHEKEVSSQKGRTNVGLCPQSNPLFDKLTVDEHLWLIYGLKGASGNYETEANNYLAQLDLSDKIHVIASNLSGGMKRKLSVIMALIGGSSIVLLDEPTAGMDPGARRDIEKILAEEKQRKTIVLTTHYMDEAEILGDRIAIMARGRIVACGSTQFMKRRFGSGYVMTVVAKEEESLGKLRDSLIGIVRKHVSTAELGDTRGRQIEITLPKDEQKNFPNLFEALEASKDDMGIDSFGLSLNNLEQVFVKVCELAEPVDPQEAEKIRSLNQELIESQKDERHVGAVKVLNQIASILQKRVLYSYRNKFQLIGQIIIPILLLLFMLQKSDFDDKRTFDLDEFSTAKTALQSRQNSSTLHVFNKFKSILEKSRSIWPLFIDSGDLSGEGYLDHAFDYPPVAFGLTSFDALTLWYNSLSHTALPTALNTLHNAKLQSLNGDKISTTLYIFNRNSETLDTLSVLFPFVAFVIFSMALITSPFVMFLVEERKTKFAHQQSLTGISPITFWGGSILYDFIFYVTMCTIFIIVFVSLGLFSGYIGSISVLWLMFFWAMMPFIYAVSFIFDSPTKASIILTIYQLIAPILAIIMCLILYLAIISTNFIDFTHFVNSMYMNILIFLLPSFGLAQGIGVICFNIMAGSSASDHHIKSVWDFDELGHVLLCMFLFGVVAWTLFLFFQFKIIRQLLHRLGNRFRARVAFGTGYLENDDVSKERTVVEMNPDSPELTMVVKDLCKSFGSLKAVDRLTMGIRNRECFGLLGINGSGKTTTFDILTGQSFASRGKASIDGKSVTKQLAIGYCPQFDALLPDLTGKETLMILARQYGFKSPERKAKLVLNAVGLTEHANKLTKYYSGGQRRKLSVGLALMATTRIIILDEPTAGIDPKARRDIWEVLSAVRDFSNSALLLTSHSMEECEALCSRIAILSKGRMVAIGSSQYLKSRYSNSYTLTMVASNSEHKVKLIKDVAMYMPSSVLKTARESSSLTVKWEIPRNPTDSWSEMFSRFQLLSADLKARDFCLAQSTLEETFMVISQETL